VTAEVVKTSPRWQGLAPTGKRLDNGDMEPGEPIVITCSGEGHGKDQGATLCPGCLEDFERVLADVPELLDDLDIAIAGEVRFVEHGFRAGSLEGDGVGASRNPAVAAHQRLCLALSGDDTNAHPGCAGWFDARDPAQLARHLLLYLNRLVGEPRLPVLAHDISSAAKRAHHVIDMPKDLVFYGPCPECGRDITQERIHRDDQETLVQCRFLSCGYGKTLDLHYKLILDANEDRWMTVSELVSAITSGGEIVNRNQIYYWERKGGLAREERSRAKWVGGELVTEEVWCFRLGDVRQRAADAANRNGKITA
jgi:hypothetical protein